MSELLAAYPYLAYAGVLLLLCLMCWLAWTGPPRAQGRRTLWLSFLIGAPFALFSFEFIPKYWHPNLIWWLGPTSLEDLLFSASVSGLAWFAAAWPLRSRLTHTYLAQGGPLTASDWGGLLKRFSIGAAPGIATAYAIGYGLPGTEVMIAVLWGIGVGGTWIIWLERRMWPLALNGALAFCLGYTLLVKLVLSLTPDFMQAWGAGYQPHVWVWGIPLYEMAWAAAFGAVWPLFAGWCFGTELIPKSD